MKINEIKKLLVEEMENKKQYDAKYFIQCEVCTGNIEENEPLYFLGDGLKICQNCMDEIIGWLED